ncbi:hypothetical protein PHMEG_00040856, partial [Phytophthora megakarya]
MATAFGVSPYVIVQKYTASQSCDPTKVASIATYSADGVCHQTGASASYAATRASDGSAVIKTYTDSATCATTGTKLVVTAAQATGNSCAANANGILDTKIFGAGTTSSVFKSTVSYSVNTNQCVSGTPTQVSTTVVDLTSSTCTATTACTGSSAPYTGTTCTSVLTYQDDMATAFGANPYVIVQKYTASQNCDPTKVASIATYSADGVCHQTGALASYAATRASDGSAVIKSYTDSATCATT